MAEKKVTVMAKCKAKPGMEDNVRKELMALVGPTRLEPGCINYDLHCSNEDKSLFMFYENWKSKQDLDSHLEMPHLKNFIKKAETLLVEPIEIVLWEMIS
ncbi:Antibiotic biosynthesis monooxygenase [Desulfonema limicola]|uniref:Antibiotic biosynthesis monooxygenase n=1 Tax=Desulfonema limicola TaxID=45656 RepID=A0A975B9P2_9BACT|nr:putative quinol monooxygenase [Desulfonema limicola]QTA81438.1 Antibiotic biosynthesis monooxygenase [Desulfonema limicola]